MFNLTLKVTDWPLSLVKLSESGLRVKPAVSSSAFEIVISVGSRLKYSGAVVNWPP